MNERSTGKRRTIMTITEIKKIRTQEEAENKAIGILEDLELKDYERGREINSYIFNLLNYGLVSIKRSERLALWFEKNINWFINQDPYSDAALDIILALSWLDLPLSENTQLQVLSYVKRELTVYHPDFSFSIAKNFGLIEKYKEDIRSAYLSAVKDHPRLYNNYRNNEDYSGYFLTLDITDEVVQEILKK
jgi:hypothetical protein